MVQCPQKLKSSLVPRVHCPYNYQFPCRQQVAQYSQITTSKYRNSTSLNNGPVRAILVVNEISPKLLVRPRFLFTSFGQYFFVPVMQHGNIDHHISLLIKPNTTTLLGKSTLPDPITNVCITLSYLTLHTATPKKCFKIHN